MINRIIASIIFVCFLFALSLSLLGVEGPIELGLPFKVFLGRCSHDLESLSFEIPQIPEIPSFNIDNGFLQFVDYLRKFVNFVSTILNFVVMIINYLIQLIMFIGVIFKNLMIMRDGFIAA